MLALARYDGGLRQAGSQALEGDSTKAFLTGRQAPKSTIFRQNDAYDFYRLVYPKIFADFSGTTVLARQSLGRRRGQGRHAHPDDRA